MKVKEKKHSGASATKTTLININVIHRVIRNNHQPRHKSGIINKLTSMPVSNLASNSPVKMKITPLQWMERYAWHGVFILSGVFWMAVAGFVWFLASL